MIQCVIEYIVYIFNIVALMGYTYLYALEESVSDLLACILLVVALLYNKFASSRPQPAINPDHTLIDQLLTDLPSACRGMKFLRHDGVGPIYSTEDVEELHAFVYKWDSPDHCFHHRGLEKRRHKFLTSLNKYLNTLSSFSSPAPGNPYVYTVKRGDGNYKKQDTERKQLISHADEAYTDYEELVTYARKRLCDL